MVEKFDNFELLIFFALYIAKQDHLSKVEYQTLIDDIPLIKNFYFENYGEYIHKDAIETIKKVESSMPSFMFEENINSKEINLIKKLFLNKKIKSIALLLATHVAEADSLSSRENNKLIFWKKTFHNEA